jgi:hypothetical protein
VRSPAPFAHSSRSSHRTPRHLYFAAYNRLYILGRVVASMGLVLVPVVPLNALHSCAEGAFWAAHDFRG